MEKMAEFTQTDIELAKMLIEDYEWIARDKFGELCAYKIKPYIYTSLDGTNLYWTCDNLMYNSIHPFSEYIENKVFLPIKWGDKEPVQLIDIISPPKLTINEKKYLEGVLRPFKDRVISMEREQLANGHEALFIVVEEGSIIKIPIYEDSYQFKGIDRVCYVEDLGLFEEGD